MKFGKLKYRIIIFIAFCILVVSGYQVFKILKDYHDSDEEYETIRDNFVQENPEKEEKPTPKPEQPTDTGRTYEDAEPPLTIDWEGLKAENEDIVGWIYVDGQPNISYPIVQGEDNQEYLHMTYQRSYLYAGSIFLNAQNASDFSDASSFVYGHNMRSGSMFGTLKYIMNQESYNESPYFWILTPNGDYRYHIFTEFTTEDGTETYTLFRDGGKDFLKWAEKMKEQSVVENDVELREDDFITALSTCKGAGTNNRNVVMGVLCSSNRPLKHNYFEEEKYNEFLAKQESAFDENDDMSYVITAKDTDIKIATNGYDKGTVVRDTWEDVYVKHNACLIHYEMIPKTTLKKETAKTIITTTENPSSKKDEGYHDITNGKLHKEYLKTRDLLEYTVNTYKIGENTYGQEIYGFVELKKNVILKITIQELKNDGTELEASVQMLGKLIDKIGWEEPQVTEAPSEVVQWDGDEEEIEVEDFSVSYDIEYEE